MEQCLGHGDQYRRGTLLFRNSNGYTYTRWSGCRESLEAERWDRNLHLYTHPNSDTEHFDPIGYGSAEHLKRRTADPIPLWPITVRKYQTNPGDIDGRGNLSNLFGGKYGGKYHFLGSTKSGRVQGR